MASRTPIQVVIDFIRSSIFNFLYVGYTALLLTIFLPMLFLAGRKPILAMIHHWGKAMVFLMRYVAGIKVCYRGLEYLPTGAALLAVKHQSWSDAMMMTAILPKLAGVAMKELLDYPLLGRFLRKVDMIMVDTCGGGEARTMVREGAEAVFKAGRPVVIYPEGRLVPIGEAPNYRWGIYHLYADLNTAVIPVATNIGLRWPCRSWVKTPGPAVLEFLPPISPGLEKQAFMAKLQEVIETRSNQLVDEQKNLRC